MDFKIALTLVIALLLIAIFTALLIYGVSYISVMELGDYESWSEAFGWAIAITFALLLVSFFQINIIQEPIRVYINFIGVVAPVVVSGFLIAKGHVRVLPAVVSTGLTAIVSYLLVRVHNGSLVMDFPLWLFPIAVAAGMALIFENKSGIMRMAGLAYFAGCMGMFIGGDILKSLTINLGEYTTLYFGANGLLDFVFLGGVICAAIVLGGAFMAERIQLILGSWGTRNQG